MNFELWLTFAAASTALLVLPGPTLLLVLSYSLSQGRSVAVASALGVATGDLIAMTLSLLGLGVILATSAMLFAIVKWAGAAYLVYLGIKMLRASKSSGLDVLSETRATNAFSIFRHTAIVTSLNPKSNGFFIAFVPQFITPEAAYAPQSAILIATFVGIATINALVFALAADKLRTQIKRPSMITGLTRAGGVTLIGMGLLTTTLRRSS